MKTGRDLMPELFEENLNDVIKSGAASKSLPPSLPPSPPLSSPKHARAHSPPSLSLLDAADTLTLSHALLHFHIQSSSSPSSYTKTR